MKCIKELSALIFALLLSAIAFGQEPNIIPKPQKLHIDSGSFDFSKEMTVRYHPRLENEIAYLKDQFYTITDKKLESIDDRAAIEFIFKENEEGQKEGYYTLEITGSGIKISGFEKKGFFYAIQTLIQIVEENKKDLNFPKLTIEDWPLLEYRGMMLDTGRHFFTVEEVKKFLDYMAWFKYNKFHWHLTEDQGWRIEIKKYPKLTEIGAWRDGTQIGRYFDYNRYNHQKHGGFYTQEEIKEVVQYAENLHIDIIPEIEMPGHAQAAVASYPELGCTDKKIEVWKRWGVSQNIYCPKEVTFQFLEDVIDEVVELFPYEYIHIGGDEAAKEQWRASGFVQNLIKELGLKDEDELQSYFITRMEKYINSKGKQIIGWDEILDGGLAPNATVMSWRGARGGIEAAKSGHMAIMTPASTNYLDYYQGNPKTEPLAWGGDLPLQKVYESNPIPDELGEEYSKFIWGTQGNLWTEYISDFQHVEYMIFPRMLALSEVAWGTAKPGAYAEFEKKVIGKFPEFEKRNINFSRSIFEVAAETMIRNDSLFYVLSKNHKEGEIHYTKDCSEPKTDAKVYKDPIYVSGETCIRAANFRDGKRMSSFIDQNFIYSKTTGKKISFVKKPKEFYYTSDDINRLVDGIRADKNNHRVDWLGVKKENLDVMIDFGEEIEISQVKFNVLEIPDWEIYYPQKVELLTSLDGSNFGEITTLKKNEVYEYSGEIEIGFPQKSMRFLRLKLENFGTIPKGYPSSGSSAYIFLDEIEAY